MIPGEMMMHHIRQSWTFFVFPGAELRRFFPPSHAALFRAGTREMRSMLNS